MIIDKQNKKNIAYISGSRADFGIMTPVLRAIKNSKKLNLQLYATGMHLMNDFGGTINEIKKEFSGVVPIKTWFKGNERKYTARFMGSFLEKVVTVLEKYKPDFLLVMGDRPEMFCVALAGLYMGIPVAHVHGGERTTTVDESARHAITRLAHLHFPATKESAERIRKMGEEKWRITTVGAPALDTIIKEKLPTRDELFRSLNINPAEKIALVTFHPVSEKWRLSGQQMGEIMAAIKGLNMVTVIIYPNTDAGSHFIINEIEKEKNNPRFRIYKNLPYKHFLALEREASVWIGNSSAAMIESAYFGTPVVNVGDRQRNRERGDNVIDVRCIKKDVVSAIRKSIFKEKRYGKKIWGDGRASKRIVKILEDLKITNRLLEKQITY
ncbi:MAG: UDP-N-acetylglucosamine 2-epimerase [bacterium]|nr:UDP-N-acetylglucosamine 2-epimerase [bacterium]